MWALSQKQKQEVDALQKSGHLHPVDIVAFAENPKTELHKRFDWDDGEAAAKWRLEQARGIIRVYVQVHKTKRITTRAFVSLSPDRKTGGGYTAIGKILSDEDKYEQMLADALVELEIFRNKYLDIKELASVLKEIDRVVPSKTKSRGKEIAAYAP